MKNQRDGGRTNRSGTITRTILGDSQIISASGTEGSEMWAAIETQLDLFREKFGREPADDDPVFFDPDCDEPTPLSEAKLEALMVEGMEKAGIDPALIYAFQQTGRIVTDDNMSMLTDDELDEHLDAVRRHRAMHG